MESVKRESIEAEREAMDRGEAPVREDGLTRVTDAVRRDAQVNAGGYLADSIVPEGGE